METCLPKTTLKLANTKYSPILKSRQINFNLKGLNHERYNTLLFTNWIIDCRDSFSRTIIFNYFISAYIAVAVLMALSSAIVTVSLGYNFKKRPKEMVARAISIACTHSSKGRTIWLVKLLITVVLMYACGFVYTPFITLMGHAAMWFSGKAFLKRFDEFAKELITKQLQQEVVNKTNIGSFDA